MISYPPQSEPNELENADPESLLMSPMPTGASLLVDEKAKSAEPQSPYGSCYLTTLTTDTTLPYTFWSVYLHYPEHIVSDAGDAKASYKYRLKDDDGTIYLLANCVIPATNEAASLVDELLRDSIREYEKPPSTGKTLDALITSNSQDWCSLPNSEGYSCMEGTCWHSIDMNTCCGPDGCGLPEMEVVSEIDDCTDCGEGGGGGPLPPPDDPDDPWLPPPNGGGGGVCTTCNPGDTPGDDDELCPLGEIADGNGGCIGADEDPCESDNPPDYCSEPDLCVGDPLPNPEVTPSNGWNVKGGMFGPTRNCDSDGLNCDIHDGIDISAQLNSPLYSMHSGTVVERRHPPMDPGEYDRRVRTWGNYVIIESDINGETVRFRYAHLNEMHVSVGTTIYVGQQIGLSGNTGNAQDNGNIVVLPHVHVQSWKVVNGQKIKVDPNDYMSTKFNSNGTINSLVSSCDQ